MFVASGVLAVAGVFSLGITGGHIGFDDWGYTSGCPFVSGGLSWANVRRAFCDLGYGAIWMPVTFVSYMIDVSLFGDSWHAYHSTNVLLHLLNLCLVFLFLKSQVRLFVFHENSSTNAICAVCALLWALHPMRAESVTFVASRKEELWTLFALLGLLRYGVFLRRGGVSRYLIVILLFVLAGMSKPTAVCFPFLALAVHVAARRAGTNRSYAWLIPMIGMSITLGLLTVYSQSHPTNGVSIDLYQTKTWWRLLNAAVSIGLYCWYTVIPFGVHMDYLAVFDGCPADAWLGMVCLFVVSVGGLYLIARRGSHMRSAVVHSAALFFISIGPTLGVFGYVNGDQAMADRYTYFPHIALVFVVAIFLIRFAMGSPGRLRWSVATALLVAAVEAVLAVPVVRSYETGYTASLRALKKDPNNWRALRTVGNEYLARMNRIDDGISMLRKSLKIRGSQITADSLAYALSIRGRHDDFSEVKRLGAAIAAKPSLDEGGMMLDALGIVSMREGEWDLAARYFACGLKVHKRNHSTDFSKLYLALSLANLGKDESALGILRPLFVSKNGYVRSRALEASHIIRTNGNRVPFSWE